MDPENFADQAYLTMNAWQVELADSRIGCLRLFSPDNPTGRACGPLPHRWSINTANKDQQGLVRPGGAGMQPISTLVACQIPYVWSV